jgi:hypothetical protein
MTARPPQRGGAGWFTTPAQVNHRRYEALRAFFVDGLTYQQAADRFGYTRWAMVNLVREHRAGKLELFAPPRKPGPPPGIAPGKERVRGRVIQLRRQGLSTYEISARLAAEHTPLNRTSVAEILAEEGFGRLLRGPAPAESTATATPGRDTRLPRAAVLDFDAWPRRLDTTRAGLLLVLPDLVALDLDGLIRRAGYPATRVVPAASWLLSLLALKLTRTRRVSHVDDLLADPAAGLLAGLGTLPKKSALTSYSYRLSHDHQRGFLAALDQQLIAAGLATSQQAIFDLDFHAVMHWGHDPALGGWCLSRAWVLAMWSCMGENYMAVVLEWERPMTLGLAQRQGDLLDDVTRFCDQALPEASVYGLLHRERDRLFPGELFADLFSGQGRRCVPPSVVATVMVLQRLEGLSDREAVERSTFDARWRYACGVGGYDSGGWGRFAHTVLVDMRERLRRSERPDRVFEVALAAAKQAGLVGRRRVLDSTPLYDAVATMDTVTLIRSAVRGLLGVADEVLEAELRAVLQSGDDYASSAKPQIDWDDATAREALVDSRAKDAFACLAVLDGRELAPVVAEAARLLATVVGQDLQAGDDGVLRIARKVARDRVISTVDPMLAMGIRPRPVGSTATRATPRSIPTAS